MNQSMANLNVNMFNNLMNNRINNVNNNYNNINNSINNMNNYYNKVLVNFIYNGENKTFEANPTSKMKEIFNKFSTGIKVNLESFIFLYNGLMINEDSELKDLISNINQNEIKILVYDKNDYNQNKIKETANKSEKNSDIILSKYPICPKCGGIIRIDVVDYKINLFECDRGHEIKGLTFKKYAEMQKMDETKIICYICKQTNKANTFENKFYKCYSCKINLCPICKSLHDKSHEIISYDKKDFNCQIHKESYNSYCNQCKINICIECESEHDKHDMISLGKFFPNKNNLKNYYNELKDKIHKFNELIYEIINKMNEVVKAINIYYKIISNHIDNYQAKKRNYQILQNINDFQKNKIILDDITKIINESDIIFKIDYIFNIYNKIKDRKENYEETIENKDSINIYKDNKSQEKQNKFNQLKENSEKYLKEKIKYDELNKKYEQLFKEYKNSIEEINKLNQEISELEEMKKQYQIMKNDYSKLNTEKSKYKEEKNKVNELQKELEKYKEEKNKIYDINKKHLEEKNKINLEIKKFEQLYKESLNKYKDEKIHNHNLKKIYENQKKQIEESNKIITDLENICANNRNIKEKLKEEKNKNKILEDKIKENEKKFNECIKSKDNEIKTKDDYIKKEHEKTLELNKKLEDNNNKYNELIGNLNKYIHHGIKCKKCFEEPIIGYRYKCSICKNYNLCEKCEEKNEISKAHPHNFIKIGNEYKEGQELPNFAFIKNNNSNNTNKDLMAKKEYSYDCLNKNKLSSYIYEGTDEVKIEIILKNNGKEDWPKDCAKLIFNRASNIEGNDIILEPQKSGEQKIYHAIFKKVSKYHVGEYKSYLLFSVNDETFGEELELTVGIKENKNKSEIDKNIDRINEFRENYYLDKDEYPNEKLLEALKKNDFDYEDAFSSLFA